MAQRPLEGRAAFISGGGRNIGRAVAVRLGTLGCNVVVNGARSTEDCEHTASLVRQAGGDAAVVMGDVGDRAALLDVTRSAATLFGGIDILINNAAIRPHKSFLDLAEEEWHEVVDTALTASFRTAQAFLPHMVEHRWGRIVNLTGMKAIKGYFEGAPISAAKGGVWGLTKALAQEFGPKGITVNAVSPGQVKSEGRDGDDSRRASSIPVGHLAEPYDIAAAICFLASPESRFVNGQMIAVNGGEAT